MSAVSREILEILSRHLEAATDAAEAAYRCEAAAFSALDATAKQSVAGNAYSDRALCLDVLREDIADSRDSVARMISELMPWDAPPLASTPVKGTA